MPIVNVFENFTGILNEYIEQGEVKRLFTYAYSTGKPNSWQTDNQGDRKWWKKKILRPINFDKYRKNSAINDVFTNSRSNICQKISLKFLILRCEWKLILIMFHSCLSLQIRTWKKYRDKKKSLFDVSCRRLSSLHHEMKICTELTFIKFLCIYIQGVNIFMEYFWI